MVFGHTLDALLATPARAEPLIATYWVARGFTAPLFMVVSGWAVTVAASRGGARGLALVRARFPRVLLLFTLGYALRWPGWGISLLREGDGGVWAHLLAFDALHSIAAALLVSSFVLALPWSDRRKAGAFGALVLAAVGLGISPLTPLDPAMLPRTLPLLALAQVVGGTSTFPLFPWVGYFFLGAILGLVGGRRPLAVAAAGAGLTAAAVLGGLEVAAGDPRLFAFRAGVVLLFLATLSVDPGGPRDRRPADRARLARGVRDPPAGGVRLVDARGAAAANRAAPFPRDGARDQRGRPRRELRAELGLLVGRTNADAARRQARRTRGARPRPPPGASLDGVTRGRPRRRCGDGTPRAW